MLRGDGLRVRDRPRIAPASPLVPCGHHLSAKRTGRGSGSGDFTERFSRPNELVRAGSPKHELQQAAVELFADAVLGGAPSHGAPAIARSIQTCKQPMDVGPPQVQWPCPASARSISTARPEAVRAVGRKPQPTAGPRMLPRSAVDITSPQVHLRARSQGGWSKHRARVLVRSRADVAHACAASAAV